MNLKAMTYDLDTTDSVVFIHMSDAKAIGVQENDRISVAGKKRFVAVTMISDTLMEPGTLLVPELFMQRLQIEDGEEVDVRYAPKPDSVRTIRKKMDGNKLTGDEISAVMEDIVENKLSRIEISAWLTSLYINGMDIDEIADFTMAIANTGDILKFNREPVFDFHSLGGVPGNKITPIVVSIVAAAGIMIPKLSSRAISSACGSSDFIETFCDVTLSSDELKEIVEDVGAVFAWGGAMNLAPVDDLVIKIEHPLGINPRAQMLASIMSKKVAVGATHLVVDIPTGAGTKVPTFEDAKAYAKDLMELGEKIGIKVECAITYADQPVGNAIGPNLEARECIRILEGEKHPASVIEKACECAGIILEMAGMKNGAAKAKELLDNGSAYRKFKEIVVAQHGREDLKSSDLKPGAYSVDVISDKSGYIYSINNKDIVSVAKAAGSPDDKGAGIYLYLKKGQRVEVGDKLFTIYSDNEAKLKRAHQVAMQYPPVDIEGMLIKRVSSIQ